MDVPVHDIKAIFSKALEIESPAERARYVAEACGADARLREEVEGILQALAQAGSFLESPARGPDATLDLPVAERPGTVIGPYKLLEQIGEGGMGAVYMAEQSRPVQRKVALKVIKAGMDSGQVIARFEAERQALALMDHPNIAKVLDAGTTAGRPYFVMELVKGVPITSYCDENHLTPTARLELFTQVCQAVQHAHHKGVIHRDLKPSNVLVALYDDKPVPKVIDFGVAKATGGRLTERTMFTGYGQIVGTLEYMSPEQARLNALDIDTRSDVYSLGVLLYELLTGTTPFDKKRLREAAFDEMLRMIREDEPPKPSTRLSTTEARASIAANRGMEPHKLSGLVRGELDWIVMKALEKDRNRRYETANGFAMDVQRYLTDEPVLACPPSVGYRLGKFVRRNKGPVSVALLILAVLLAGIFGTTWGMLRATLAEAEAVHEAGEKAVALSEKEAALAKATANELQAKAAQKDAQENLKEALAAVDQMLTRVGQDLLDSIPHMEPIRRELFQDALMFYQKFLAKNKDDPLIRLETAWAWCRLAHMRSALGEPAVAVKDYRQALALFDALAAESPLEPDIRFRLIVAHLRFAYTLGELGRPAEMAVQVRTAVKIAEELVQEFPKERKYRNELASARCHLARLIAADQPHEAEKILHDNLKVSNSAWVLRQNYMVLGSLAAQQRRYAAAEDAFRQVLDLADRAGRPDKTAEQSQLSRALVALADAVAGSGRGEEAAEIYARATAVLDKLAGDYPGVVLYRFEQADAHERYAKLLDKLEEKTTEAQASYRRALDIYAKLAADFPTHPTIPAFDRCLTLGQLLLRTGRLDEAQEAYAKAEAILEKLDADPDVQFKRWQDLAVAHTDIARARSGQANGTDAEPAFRKMVAILDKLEAEFAGQKECQHDLADRHLSACWVLFEARRFQDVEKLARRALAHAKAVVARVPDESARSILAGSRHVWALSLNRLGRTKEAEVELREALALQEKLAGEFPKLIRYRQELGHIHNAMGWIVRGGADGLPAAEEQHRRALAVFEQLSIDFPAEAWTQHDRAMLLETVAVLRRDRDDLAEAKSLLEQAIPYAEKACELDPNNQRFRDRFESIRRELAAILKAQKPAKN